MPQRLLRLVLVALMSSLTPVAHANPPDQHWLGRVYDNADYDDVVLAIAVVFPTDERVHAAPRHSSNTPRAPPAS